MSAQFGPPEGGSATDLTSQLAWFIDSVGGSDSNNGLTSGTALQTLTAWFLKSCNNGQFTFNTPGVVVTILRDLLTSDQPRGTIHVATSGENILTFIGTPTQIAASSGSITVTALNAATNTPWSVRAVGVGNWSTYSTYYTKYRIEVLGGDPRTFAWAALNLGSSTARWSSPMTADPALGPFGQTLGTIDNTGSFTIDALPQMFNFGLSFDAQATTSGPEAVIFQDLAFAPFDNEFVCVGPLLNDIGIGNQLGFYGCSFASIVFTGGNLINCHIQDGDVIQAGYVFGGCAKGNLAIRGEPESVIIDFQHMVQSDTLSLGNGALTIFSALVSIGSVQLYDSDIGLHVYFGGVLYAPSIFGTDQLFGSSTQGGPFVQLDPNKTTITYESLTGLTGLFGSGSSGAVAIGEPQIEAAYSELPISTVNAGMFLNTNEGPLSLGGASPAQMGVIRLANAIVNGYIGPDTNGVLMAMRNFAGSADLRVFQCNTGDDFVFGSQDIRDAYLRSSRDIILLAGSFFGVFVDGANSNVQVLKQTPIYSNGAGMFAIPKATTIPTANPSEGVLLYVDPADNILKARGSAGTVTPIALP